MARGISSYYVNHFCLEKDFFQKFPLNMYALAHRAMLARSSLLSCLCAERKTSLYAGRIGDWTVSVRCTKLGGKACRAGPALLHLRIVCLPIVVCFRFPMDSWECLNQSFACSISLETQYGLLRRVKQPIQRAESPQNDYISASQHLFLNPLFFFKAVRQMKWLWYIM